MPTYVWRNDRFIDKRTGEPMPVRDDNAICKPYICSDIKEYISPVTGLPITSRSHRREDLKRHDCIEVDPPKKPRALTNPRFAAKHRLPFGDEAKEAAANKAKRDAQKIKERLNGT